MDDDERYRELLRRKAEDIKKSEGARFESTPRVAARHGVEAAAPDLESVSGRTEAANLEAIILWHRPVLWIEGDEVERGYRFTDPNDQTSPAILELLETRRSVLTPTIPAIGRVEVANNALYEWVGSGWVVASDLGHDIVVTNAHVARLFAQRSGSGFVFSRGTVDFGGLQSGTIDFREEMAGGAPREFAITDVIWISDDEVLDIALLRAAVRSGEDRLAGPIRLAPEAAVPGRNVAVIGYPGDDSKSYDAEKFERLFGRVFGKKRLAPGRLTEPHAWGLTHDCSTLPGNSGSVVLDIETGAAVGLHYSGSMFRANYAVPAAELVRILRDRPWQGEAARQPLSVLADNATPHQPSASSTMVVTGDASTGVTIGSDRSIKIVIPLEISVKLGVPDQARVAAGGTDRIATKTDRAAAESSAALAREHLARRREVLTVKADYLFRDGTLTDEYGVVVRVAPDASLDLATYNLRAHIGGVQVSVESADPETIAADRFGPVREAFKGRSARYKRDLSEPRFDLSSVTDDMKLTLHVSPEAGWPVLREFLAEDRHKQLTIGMYHMTAPHVVAAIKEVAGRRGSKVTLTLDRQRGDAAAPDDTSGDTKKNDIPESTTLDELTTIAGDRFKWTQASLGGSALFATAYHIKVAVWSDPTSRGSRTVNTFWLSSGNWQSSNQAPIERPVAEIDEVTWEDVAGYNREWHALVAHAELATTFRNHLEQDYEDNVAAARIERLLPDLPDILVPLALFERPRRPSRFRPFVPKVIEGRVTIQPLLTPDNYPEIVARLIANARERVLIENQSFALWKEINDTPEHFLKIATAVKERQQDGLDVRIIFRSGFGKERETLRRLKAFGIETDAGHIRFFDTCHTKGLVIDRDVVVLGSQNWTAAGTGPNRDASLAITHPDANAYFAEVFEYDWEHVADRRVRPERAVHESIRILPAGVEASVPSGYRRISLAEFLGET